MTDETPNNRDNFTADTNEKLLKPIKNDSFGNILESKKINQSKTKLINTPKSKNVYSAKDDQSDILEKVDKSEINSNKTKKSLFKDKIFDPKVTATVIKTDNISDKIITLITTVLYISMTRFYMCFKSSFLFCLVFTQITSVPHISMNRIQMSFKNSFQCCLIITLITSVPHISLNRFYMCFKNSFPFCLVITLITGV